MTSLLLPVLGDTMVLGGSPPTASAPTFAIDYAPGDALAPGDVFSRALAAPYTTAGGTELNAAGGVLRDGHYVDMGGGTRARTTRLGPTDTLSFAWPGWSTSGTFYALFKEGAMTAGDAVLSVVAADTSNVFRLYRETNYLARLESPYRGSQFSATPILLPRTGNVVELLGTVYPDGSVEAAITVNGSAVRTAARSAAGAFPASTGGYLRVGSGADDIAFASVRYAPGIWTMEQMRGDWTLPARARVVFDGNSHAAGFSDGVRYPSFVTRDLPEVVAYENTAVTGQTTAQMTARIPTALVPALSTTVPNVVVAWEATNSLAAGRTGAQAWADLQAYVAAVRSAAAAAGATVSVVSMMAMPRGADATQEAARVAFNTLFASGAAALLDGVVRLPALLTDPGSQNNATYFEADTIHLTAAGAELVAAAVVPVVSALAGLYPLELFTGATAAYSFRALTRTPPATLAAAGLWSNQATGAADLVQATAGARPTLGADCFTFDGTDDRLAFAAPVTFNVGTWAFVVRADAGAVALATLASQNGDARNIRKGSSGSVYRGPADSGEHATGGSLRVNGVETTTCPVGTRHVLVVRASAAGGWTTLAFGHSVLDRYWKGQIVEAIAFPTVLTATQVTALESEMAARYQIALP